MDSAGSLVPLMDKRVECPEPVVSVARPRHVEQRSVKSPLGKRYATKIRCALGGVSPSTRRVSSFTNSTQRLKTDEPLVGELGAVHGHGPHLDAIAAVMLRRVKGLIGAIDE